MTKTHEKYVQEVFEYWGNEYEIIGLYSGALSKIKVRHNICGIEWDVIAVSLITGHGCRKCANKNNGKSQRKSHKDFVKDSFKIWGYEYSVLGEYLNTKTKILVKHNKCKNSWDVNPADFLSGHGCPFCDGKRVSDKNRLSIIYPEISKEWHPDKNKKIKPCDVSYGSNTDFWWLCKKCGNSWKASPHLRTSGKGVCLQCSVKSKGEKIIEEFLIKNNIFYVPQKTFLNCRNILPLPFDFGIPYKNNRWTMIEYQGEQHFSENKFFKKCGGHKGLVKRDKIKTKYCKDNNIKLIRIPYWDFNDIKNILSKELL